MIGRTIGGYRITQRLGQGGMGIVYAARHEKLPKRAAVKILSTAVAQDSSQVARFFTEAKAISLLSHPGIVTLYDYGQMSDGTVYMLMELLTGQTLKERMERAPPSMAQALQIAREVALALAVVHRHEIVHRDLKPANIMLVPSAEGGERVKVVDFGIAKFVQSLESSSAPGTVLGTPAYMAPEQCEGNAVIGDRTDVYALGIVLYELLTGQYPYELKDRSWTALFRAHREQAMLPLSASRPEVPLELATVVREMLDKEPTRRPSMAELAARLQLELGAEGRAPQRSPLAPPPATQTAMQPDGSAPAARSGRRVVARKLWLLGSGATLLVSTGIGVWFLQWARSPARAPVAPAGMRYLAGGRIRMGSSPAEVAAALKQCREENPLCQADVFDRELNGPEIRVAPFFLDALEATNEQFVWLLNHPPGQRVEVKEQRYVRLDQQLALDLHPQWGGIKYDPAAAPGAQFSVIPGRADQPVSQVTFYGADWFCRAKGYRLPTEPEWELAARGLERRMYPWGDSAPTCTGANLGRWHTSDGRQGPCWNDAALHKRPVGSSPQDRSPDSIFDLGGNVEEWTQDAWASPYQPHVQEAPTYRAVRGGAWNDTMSSARGSGRTRWEPGKLSREIGFRCASSAQP